MMAPPQPERFIYVDEAGEPVGCVDRHGRSDGTKSFVQHRYERGTYIKGLDGRRLPLYRLPELRARIGHAQVVFIVEGERKADALATALRGAKAGAAVTTIAGGANAKLTAEHLEQLRGGKEFVVLADSDAPGRKAAKERAEAIAAAYPNATVRIVDLYPAGNDGLDIDDWLAENHSFDEFRALIAAVPRVTPPLPMTLPHGLETGPRTAPKVAAFVSAGELLAESDEEVPALVDGLLGLGSTAMVAAKPKVGKTSWQLNLALAVARGSSFWADR